MPVIRINNTTLEFDNIYYVDAIDGDDDTGDGSKNSPFKTFTKAYNSCAASGDAIYLGEGEYPTGSSGYYTIDKEVSITGEEAKTKLTNTGDGIAIGAGKKANFYRMIINCNPVLFALSVGDSAEINVYNCVFDSTCTYGSMGASSYTYNVKANIYNSVFIGGSGSCVFSSYANGTPKGLVKNCISIDPITLHTYSGRAAWSLTQVSNLIGEVDQSYNIIGQIWQNTGTGTNPDGLQANIGAYGGEFAWGEWNPFFPFINDNGTFKTWNPDLSSWQEPDISEPLSVQDFLDHGMDREALNDTCSLKVIKGEQMEYTRDLGDGREFKTVIDLSKWPTFNSLGVRI